MHSIIKRLVYYGLLHRAKVHLSYPTNVNILGIRHKYVFHASIHFLLRRICNDSFKAKKII